MTTDNPTAAWAVAHLAIANTAGYGLSAPKVGPYAWTHSTTGLASWQGTHGPADTARSVTLEFPDLTALSSARTDVVPSASSGRPPLPGDALGFPMAPVDSGGSWRV